MLERRYTYLTGVVGDHEDQHRIGWFILRTMIVCPVPNILVMSRQYNLWLMWECDLSQLTFLTCITTDALFPPSSSFPFSPLVLLSSFFIPVLPSPFYCSIVWEVVEITRTETSFSPMRPSKNLFASFVIPNHLLPPINFYFYLYSCSLRYARSLFPFNISFCTRGWFYL